MKLNSLLTRSIAATLLVLLSATWLGANAWMGPVSGAEWAFADEEPSSENEEDAQPELKAFHPIPSVLLLPGRLLLSQVNAQDGQLPPEHVSEVPVPPPLVVR
jgi:hypothetical protein